MTKHDAQLQVIFLINSTDLMYIMFSTRSHGIMSRWRINANRKLFTFGVILSSLAKLYTIQQED